MNIGLIGNGVMGLGIAQLLATTDKLNTVWYGRDKEHLQSAYQQLEKNIKRLSSKKNLLKNINAIHLRSA